MSLLSHAGVTTAAVCVYPNRVADCWKSMENFHAKIPIASGVWVKRYQWNKIHERSYKTIIIFVIIGMLTCSCHSRFKAREKLHDTDTMGTKIWTLVYHCWYIYIDLTVVYHHWIICICVPDIDTLYWLFLQIDKQSLISYFTYHIPHVVCFLFYNFIVATGFPTGQTPLETRLEEIRRAVQDGASEVDIVINRTLALGGDWKGDDR